MFTYRWIAQQVWQQHPEAGYQPSIHLDVIWRGQRAPIQGAHYDVVFDAVSKVPPAHAKKALKQGGVYLNVHRHSDRGDLKEALGVIRNLREVGTIKAMIDRCCPLEQIVAAHRYVDSGHKRGNIAITVQA